jgi:hypothetical protein
MKDVLLPRIVESDNNATPDLLMTPIPGHAREFRVTMGGVFLGSRDADAILTQGELMDYMSEYHIRAQKRRG